jgi:hypothetical protein
VICVEKNRVRHYSRFADALESIRWWVVLCDVERTLFSFKEGDSRRV